MKTTRLHIDFAPNARQVSWPPRLLLGVVVVVFLAGAVHLGDMLAGNARQAAELAELQARHSAASSGATRPSAPLAPGELIRTRAVRQTTQKLVTPWADLLEALESAPNQSVALLSVEPSVSKRNIRLTAEARTPADMLAYLAALQQDTRLSSAVLTSHQVQAQSPGAPVRFQIQAGWGVEP